MPKYSLKRFIKKQILKVVSPQTQASYAQFGEDLIIDFFFSQQGIIKPTYLDVGANEPRFISNTYFFYKKGSTGVLIEPNPFLYKKLKAIRSKDLVLNCGIGFNELEEADFYIFPNHANGLNTFSKKEVEYWQEVGMKGLGKISIEKIIKMKLVPINTILANYFDNKTPDIISLDVEGLDFEILKSLDFEKYRPFLICVETLKYDETQNVYKNGEITELMISKNYSVYADTRVNTIYCKNDL